MSTLYVGVGSEGAAFVLGRPYEATSVEGNVYSFSVFGGTALGMVAGGIAGTAAGVAAGAAAGATAGAILGPIGSLVGCVIGIAAGNYATMYGAKKLYFDPRDNTVTPPPPWYDISDETWPPFWNHVYQQLQEAVKQRYVRQPLESHVGRVLVYEKAIQNGAAEMISCGHIVTIGKAAERLVRVLTKSLKSAGMNDQSVYTLCNGEFFPKTEEAELVELATLANKVNKSSDLSVLNNIMMNARLYQIAKKVYVFPDRSHDAVTTRSVDDKISSAVKKIATNIMNKVVFCSSPALIHTSNHSWEQLKHFLPVFTTSYSFFLVVINSEDKNVISGNQHGANTLEEDMCHSIACIVDDLCTNQYVCLDPQIVVIGTYNSDEQRTQIHVQSTIENIQKWVKLNCSNTKLKTILLNSANQAAPEIQTLVTKLITRDIKISTPLTWELFHRMFSHVTKNFSIVQVEKAASIALLCGISDKEFPCVLHFYHEHGVFLYYPDVQYLNNVIITDPMWLQEKLNLIFTPINPCSSQSWKRLISEGILTIHVCEEIWKSEEVEGLSTGLVKLLEKYNLVAPIDIDQETKHHEYFVPFVLKSKGTAVPHQVKSKLCTAPLHFTFSKTKHISHGVFTYLNAALASKRNSDFVKCEVFCDQITYSFQKHDKVILSTTLTSVCVVVERLTYSGDEYPTSNFWFICQKIFLSLSTEINAVLQKSFQQTEAIPAFCCTCLPEGLPHYVTISSKTFSTCTTLQCDEKRNYPLNGDEQLWLKMAAPSFKLGKLFKREVNVLVESLQPSDQEKLTQALEITAIDSGRDCKRLINEWAETTGADARKHLMYHLNRLGMAEAAHAINTDLVSKELNDLGKIVPRHSVTLLQKRLGHGAWGYVDKGKLKDQLVAVKCVHEEIITEHHVIERVYREINTMAHVCHSNLVQFIAAVLDDQGGPMIITELLDTTLRKAYEDSCLKPGVDQCMDIFHDVASALCYLHGLQEPIIHRDVSTANVLMKRIPMNRWIAKLADFGSANLLKLASTMGEGNIVYIAPEALPDSSLPQTTKIDVYSYGIVLCEVTLRKFPYSDQLHEMKERMKTKHVLLHTLMENCTQKTPDIRPTMVAVLEELENIRMKSR